MLKMLISPELEAQIKASKNNILIMIFTLYYDFLWQMVHNHGLIQSYHVGRSDISKI